MNIYSQITINDIDVQIVRKKIKNLHLRVHSPDGCVRVSAPLHIDDDEVRLTVLKKIRWIRKQQTRITNQPVKPEQQMLSGESHYFLGRHYLLDVVECRGKHKLELRNDTQMLLSVRPGTCADKRGLVMTEWYRQQIKDVIPGLIQKWEPVIGVKVDEWGVKKMKTRWGTCNITDSRIWLNLELVKKPMECLEYVLVHEMVHLLERYHNDKFKAYMDRFMPQWRLHQDTLNRIPIYT